MEYWSDGKTRSMRLKYTFIWVVPVALFLGLSAFAHAAGLRVGVYGAQGRREF